MGVASGDGRREQRRENGKADGETVGQETWGTMKRAISETRVLEIAGKRIEGVLSRWRISSNLRGLLKRKQELFAFYAMQSLAGQGSSLQGRLSLVMETSYMQTPRVQGSMQWCRRLAEAHCRSCPREGEIECLLLPSSLRESIALFCFKSSSWHVLDTE